MGVSPQDLVDRVDRDHDDVDEFKRGNDVQSTVSSHPAFDAKNLVHFMEFVDEQHPVDHLSLMDRQYADGMVTGREYKEDEEENMSSATSNSLDEYSYSTSNEEQYVLNDAISLASADHDAKRFSAVRPCDFGLIPNIKEDEEMITPNGLDTVNESEPSHSKQREYLNVIFNGMYRDSMDRQSEWNTVRGDVYGAIISFMGRHDRWLHCRLVCKLWSGLVHDEHWIYPSNLTMHQVNALRPGLFTTYSSETAHWWTSSMWPPSP